MQVFAHRGASIERPENTLAAFALALEHGAEGIELDVVRAKDGKLAVIHDATLDRTTDATGAVIELTSEELRKVDAGEGQYVPTLEEVLALAEGKARVNIELKEAEAVDGVLGAVAQFPALDWFASSAHWEALEELRQRAGAEVYPLTLGTEENRIAMIEVARQHFSPEEFAGWEAKMRDRGASRDLVGALEWCAQVGAAGVSIYEKNLTAEMVQRIHGAGLEAWVWTVNDPGRAMELAALGVDALCTDAPAEVMAAREAAPVA